MLGKLQVIWEEMIKEAERESNGDENIVVHKNRKAVFQNTFEQLYRKIKNTYMMEEVVFLDRHKVTSIIICSVIKTGVMEWQITDEDKVFLGNYYLALSAGLSYLQYEINTELKEQGRPLINKISFPEVMYGNLNYKENLIRMLYFSNEEDKLNVLALANIVFLLENFNLLQ